MTYPRYYKVCPRGFANEVIYLRIDNDTQAEQVEREYGDLADREPHNGYAEWTNDLVAGKPGVAANYEDRHWALPLVATTQ